MRYFVPEDVFRRAPTDKRGLLLYLREISGEDLPRYVQQAHRWLADYQSDPFYGRIDAIEGLQSECLTFGDFLRRPSVTVNACSKLGFSTAQGSRDAACEMGELLKDTGYNCAYGGGKDGLMGLLQGAFAVRIPPSPFQHQYSGQILPSWFVDGSTGTVVGGFKPTNEGLFDGSDYAIIGTGGLDDRKIVMRNQSVGTITLPGSFGSLDEYFYGMVHDKIGRSVGPTVLLNCDGFFDDIVKTFIPKMIHHYGMEKKEAETLVHVAKTPKEAVAIIRQASGDPEALYHRRSDELDLLVAGLRRDKEKLHQKISGYTL